MKVQFLGAAQTVTGSCHVIEAAGHRFAVDCGMHQGNNAIEERNFNSELYEQRHTNGKKTNHDLLYSVEEARECIKQFKPVEFNQTFEPVPNIKVTYKYAAHILGAAFIVIDITENGETKRLTFSGDLGRHENMLLFDPQPLEKTDYLFLESTYGNRNHKDDENSLDELANAIERSYKLGGKVIIPTFAVERAQEIIYSLYLIHRRGQLPKNMPIYLDSPLAIKATEVFERYKDDLDFHEIKNDMPSIADFDFKVNYTLGTEESQALNAMEGPAIILSASGMCNAGRIKHHLKHNIWRPETSIVFVGFQAVGTLGRKIVEGATSVSLMNNDLNVSAKIYTINGFSAHAGQNQLLDWVSTIAKSKPHIILIHGEKSAQEELGRLIKEKYALDVTIPAYLDEIELTAKASEEQAALSLAKHAMPKLDWQFVFDDLDLRFRQLHNKLDHVQERSWEDQTEIHDKVAKLNNDLYKLIAQL